jgi:polar amino acid transport system ATP-binding protein
MIEFRNVHKFHGKLEVLKDICLLIEKGTMCVLCGPSGAGKSTLLGTVNGLEPIQGGEIWIDGRRLGDPAVKLRRLRCEIGVVYQSYNLFPHLSVERNILLGLEKGLGLGRREAVRLAHAELERVGLSTCSQALPAQLSGGQQQRAAIARCLAMRPKILLLDEPTSALDVENVEEVVAVIRSLASQGITILLATHQLSLFVDIADSLVCMEAGRITEQGSRREIVARGCQSKVIGWITRIQTMNGMKSIPADGARHLAQAG